MFGASALIVYGGLGNVVHGTDFVLGTVNAGALRRVVDDIDEVGEQGLTPLVNVVAPLRGWAA